MSRHRSEDGSHAGPSLARGTGDASRPPAVATFAEPAELRPGRDPDAHSEHATARRPSVVLVIEDDASMRELISRVLLADGRHVIAVGSAEDAETSIRCHRPDVIVCDLVLPGRSGEEFVRRLRADSRFESIPLIVVTGLHDDDLRLRLLASGANDFLEKPFLLAELVVRVDNLLTPALRSAELRARIDELSERADQLEGALHSRVVIEQAKAFIAAEHGIGLSEAFELLRSRARSQRASIRSVACDVVRCRSVGEGERPAS